MNYVVDYNRFDPVHRILLALGVSLGLGLAPAAALAAAVPLSPLVSGIFTGGDGVNSDWVQVAGDWTGPSDFSQNYGGISSLADATAALGLSSGDTGYLRGTSGTMSNINAGNDWYNTDWGGTWGYADMPPLFGAGDPNQENYAAHIWGYVAVPEVGNYNFGVLYDDGFAFTLWGAEGSHSLSVDELNSRNRKGFDYDLALQAGLYRFDLVGYNHLEAGVLNLGWWYGPTTSDFAVIPQNNFYTTAPAVVPVPAAAWLFGSGLLGLIGVARRKARKDGA